MGTTQPIRNRQELQNFSSYYKQVKPHLRNYTLVVLGLNTALRISDLLNLHWRSVYDFKKNCFRDHLLIWEHKTGKRNYIAINQNAKNALYLIKAKIQQHRPIVWRKKQHQGLKTS